MNFTARTVRVAGQNGTQHRPFLARDMAFHKTLERAASARELLLTYWPSAPRLSNRLRTIIALAASKIQSPSDSKPECNRVAPTCRSVRYSLSFNPAARRKRSLLDDWC